LGPRIGARAVPRRGGRRAAQLARAGPGRPAPPRRPDARRLPERADRAAGQRVPPDQGPAPALTRTRRNRPMSTFEPPPADPALNPYAAPDVEIGRPPVGPAG